MDASGLFRSLDGSGNNLLHRDSGSTGEDLLRIAAAEYGNGISSAAGSNRSLAREIGITTAAALLTDDRFEQNDTPSAATNLGTLTASTTVSQLVMADSNDWYRFTLSSAAPMGSSVSMSFTHALGDLDMELYSSFGQFLRISNGITNSERVSLAGLPAGTYYVRIYGYRGATNPDYSLSVNLGTSAPQPPPVTDDSFEDNDTQATAANLGTLTDVRTVSNLVLADSQDWFRFTTSATGTSSDFASISFQNSQGNLALALYNSSGQQLAASNGTTNLEQVSLAGLGAGTYYVRITGAANPSYTLTVDPPTTTTAPPPTGSGFNIQFAFSGLTASEQAIFQQAAAKWQSIIVGDLPNATYNGQVVDDLLISASATPIDGAGNILGQAGPDRFRSGSQLPYHGTMQFDSADMAQMEANGTLLGVIEHEMGHVLGIGTLWSSKGLLVGAGTSNPLFVGPQATAEYNAIFGVNSAGVPVENGGGSGTRDSHWEESILGSELMTGYVGPGNVMPLSRITVASLADIGYTVNIANADPFTPSSSGLAAAASLAGSSSGSSSVRQAAVYVPSSIVLPPPPSWQRSVDTIFSQGRSFLNELLAS